MAILIEEFFRVPLGVQAVRWACAPGAEAARAAFFGDGLLKGVLPTPATQRPCFDTIEGGRHSTSGGRTTKNTLKYTTNFLKQSKNPCVRHFSRLQKKDYGTR